MVMHWQSKLLQRIGTALHGSALVTQCIVAHCFGKVWQGDELFCFGDVMFGSAGSINVLAVIGWALLGIGKARHCEVLAVFCSVQLGAALLWHSRAPSCHGYAQ